MRLFAYVGIFAISLFVWSCKPTQPVIDYSVNSPVQWQLEEGSEIVYKTYNVSFEKKQDGGFIYKKYYPTTSIKTFEINYLDEARTTKQGRFTHRYDNGKIWSTGNFEADKEDGEWRYYQSNGNLERVGAFKNGLKTGTWQTFSEDSLKSTQYSFNDDGELHGKYIYYNKNGEVTKELTYEDGEVIKTKTYTTADALESYVEVEKMPVYGEECAKIENEILAKICSEKALLSFIYENIRYPAFCRENDISGTAYFQFVVEKDGTVTNIKALNGVCEEIEQECIRVIDKLSTWQPGYQDGEAVKVKFNLPIRFRLE